MRLYSKALFLNISLPFKHKMLGKAVQLWIRLVKCNTLQNGDPLTTVTKKQIGIMSNECSQVRHILLGSYLNFVQNTPGSILLMQNGRGSIFQMQNKQGSIAKIALNRPTNHWHRALTLTI